jgi:Cu/Ag efflux protein CusF
MPVMAQQSAGSALSEGEVRKVDKDAKKITIKFEAEKVGGGFAVTKIEPAK